jgi:hypothetical protein
MCALLNQPSHNKSQQGHCTSSSSNATGDRQTSTELIGYLGGSVFDQPDEVAARS